MKKTIRSLLFLLLSISMLLCAAACDEMLGLDSSSGSSESESSSSQSGQQEALKPSEGLEFTLQNDGTYCVTGIGTCTDTDVVIPASVDGIKVTAIGSSAFKDCTSLTGIVIPDSVTSIDKDAFYDCKSLTSITFNGTKAQWEAIAKDEDWNGKSSIKQIVCTDGTVSVS